MTSHNPWFPDYETQTQNKKAPLVGQSITIVLDTPKGERTLSTGCTDMAEARQVIQAAGLPTAAVLAKAGQLQREMLRKLVPHGNTTVQQAVDEWAQWLKDTCNSDRTYETESVNIHAWAGTFSATTRLISEVDEHLIDKWINAQDGTKLATRRVRLSSIRSLFRFCIFRHYLSYNPTLAVCVKARELTHEQKEPKQREIFTQEEFSRLEAHLWKELERYSNAYPSPRNRVKLHRYQFWYAATLLGRYTGLRLGDICCLEWASFSAPGKMVVWTDKHDARIELPVTDDIARAIASIPTNNRPHCFPEQNEIIRDTGKRALMSVQFSRLLEEAAVERDGKSFHSLRSMLASELNAKGVNIKDIADALGHANTRTTAKHYIKEYELPTPVS